MDVIKKKFWLVFSLCWFGTGCFVAPVQAKKAASFPATASASDVRAQVFAYLAGKVGAAPAVPVLSPGQTPLRWLEEQETQPDQDSTSAFRLAGESLMLSQQLLGDKNELQRRDGLLLARESANFIASRLKTEKPLLAHVYQGFILPNIALANVERWRDPSRQRLLEAATWAFAGAGETGNEKRVLEWLLAIGSGKSSSLRLDLNTLNWTRGTLASLLAAPADAPSDDLERALELLKRIHSPSMTGFKHLQTLVEARLKSATASPQTTELKTQ